MYFKKNIFICECRVTYNGLEVNVLDYSLSE